MIDETKLEERLMQQEFAYDLAKDEAIERGTCCRICKHCKISKYPHNWYRESYYCELKKEFVQRYGICEKWEDVDDEQIN